MALIKDSLKHYLILYLIYLLSQVYVYIILI